MLEFFAITNGCPEGTRGKKKILNGTPIFITDSLPPEKVTFSLRLKSFNGDVYVKRNKFTYIFFLLLHVSQLDQRVPPLFSTPPIVLKSLAAHLFLHAVLPPCSRFSTSSSGCSQSCSPSGIRCKCPHYHTLFLQSSLKLLQII